MAIFCTSCGTQLADNAAFCTKCGAAIKGPIPPPPPATGQPWSGPSAAVPPQAGLADNVAGALAYVTIIPAILFLVMEPYNRRPFVRFHAFQCLFLFVAWLIVRALFWIPLGIGSLVLLPVRLVFGLIIFVAWLLCIINASQGKLFKLPVIGSLAEGQAGPLV